MSPPPPNPNPNPGPRPDDPLDRAVAALRRSPTPAGPSSEAVVRALAALDAAEQTPRSPNRRNRPMTLILKLSAAALRSRAASRTSSSARRPALGRLPGGGREAPRRRDALLPDDHGDPGPARAGRGPPLLERPPDRGGRGRGPGPDHRPRDRRVPRPRPRRPIGRPARRDEPSLRIRPEPRGPPPGPRRPRRRARRHADDRRRPGPRLPGRGGRPGADRLGRPRVAPAPVGRGDEPASARGACRSRSASRSTRSSSTPRSTTTSSASIRPRATPSSCRRPPPSRRRPRADRPRGADRQLLRLYADDSGGSFPPTVDDWAAYDEAARGVEFSGPADPELLRRARIISGAVLFLRQHEGRTGYRPEGVRLGDADTVLFWHRPEGSATYRASSATSTSKRSPPSRSPGPGRARPLTSPPAPVFPPPGIVDPGFRTTR